MRKREDGKALIFYSMAVFLFFALSFGSGITRVYGFTLFPDEFGYWSSAAAAAGYDWSKVTAYGSYYSFGYSLFLTPILWLGQNAVWTYRIALFVNVLLLAATFVLLQGIVGRLIPHSTPAQRVLGTGVALCYPTWLLYMNMTMTEILLVFCFVLECRLLLAYMERPTFGRFVMAGISAVYMYTVHMRSLPVLCACVGCMLLSGMERFWGHKKGHEKKNRSHLEEEESTPGESMHPMIGRAHVTDLSTHQKRSGIMQALKLLAAVCVVGAVFLLADYLKDVTQALVYGKTDVSRLSVNDYSGQLSKIKTLFTWRGISELIISLLGKVYYLSFASFGLFFAGVWFFIKKLTEKKADCHVRMFSLFVLLATVGEILVCAVYTRGYGRIDGLCYGRYDELVLPILMAFGCFAILNMKHPLLYGVTVILSGIPITALLESIIKNHHLTNINGGYFIAGLSYLLRYVSFEPENYFWKAYAFAAVLTAVMIAILLLIRRQRAYCFMLLVWIGIEVLLSMSLNEGMVYSQNRVRYRDMRMMTMIEEMPKRRIVCFGSADTGSYAAVVQFWLREETIYFYTPDEVEKLRAGDLVLVCEEQDRTALEESYTKHEVYGIFHLYYNE